MSVNLKDEVCVVIGSARSIGLRVVQMYCEFGKKVSMIDINPDVLRQAKRLLNRAHQRDLGRPYCEKRTYTVI